MSLRSRMAAVPCLRAARELWRALVEQFGFGLRPIRGVVQLVRFVGEYRLYGKLNRGARFTLRAEHIRPYLTDRTTFTPIDPTYFLQDAWCARKIAERRPSSHVDVGSSAKSMGIIAQFVPITFVDIRSVEIDLAGFSFLSGSVLELPFADSSIASLSSLCVIEHIGLGRYGDPFDARGSEKAAHELTRVLGRGGDLYVSVPIDETCRVYFNGHRAFTREYVLELFRECVLVEERYIYGRALVDSYLPARGFGTGLYHFQRR